MSPPGGRPPPSRPVSSREGDAVDLESRVFEVLHTPGGHTSGSIALWDPAGGLLFTGDTAALDDPLYAEDEDAFVGSLRRLRAPRWSSSAPGTLGRSVERSSGR